MSISKNSLRLVTLIEWVLLLPAVVFLTAALSYEYRAKCVNQLSLLVRPNSGSWPCWHFCLQKQRLLASKGNECWQICSGVVNVKLGARP